MPLEKVQCEVCHNEPATSFSYMRKGEGGEWIAGGDCTANSEMYYIEFSRFFESPEETVDWLAHMSEKDWFDAADFCALMGRIRAQSAE